MESHLWLPLCLDLIKFSTFIVLIPTEFDTIRGEKNDRLAEDIKGTTDLSCMFKNEEYVNETKR